MQYDLTCCSLTRDILITSINLFMHSHLQLTHTFTRTYHLLTYIVFLYSHNSSHHRFPPPSTSSHSPAQQPLLPSPALYSTPRNQPLSLRDALLPCQRDPQTPSPPYTFILQQSRHNRGLDCLKYKLITRKWPEAYLCSRAKGGIVSAAHNYCRVSSSFVFRQKETIGIVSLFNHFTLWTLLFLFLWGIEYISY